MSEKHIYVFSITFLTDWPKNLRLGSFCFRCERDFNGRQRARDTRVSRRDSLPHIQQGVALRNGHEKRQKFGRKVGNSLLFSTTYDSPSRSLSFLCSPLDFLRLPSSRDRSPSSSASVCSDRTRKRQKNRKKRTPFDRASSALSDGRKGVQKDAHLPHLSCKVRSARGDARAVSAPPPVDLKLENRK